jgi:putative transposase
VIGRALAVPRSSLYAREQRRLGDDEEEQRVRAHIERIAGQWPTYGYRRVTAQLRRGRGEGDVAVNGKRVRRLMHDLDLAGHAPTRRCRTTNSDHPYPRYPNLVAGLVVAQPDAVWVADITYVRLQCDFVYLAVLMDVYSGPSVAGN